MLPTRQTAPDGPLAAAPAVDTLPAWDLSDLYPGRTSPELEADFATASASAKAFSARYAGRLAALDAAGLAAALVEYQRIEEIQGRLGSYAQLTFSGDSTDPELGQFYQSVSERLTVIGSDLLFFALELNRLDEPALAAKLADPVLARWAPWLRDLRVFREHQLSDEVEKLLHEKEVTGRSAWSRLFDETVAGLRVPVAEEKLTVSAALNKLSDRDRAVRAAAAAGIGTVFADNIRLFGLITNTLAKDKEVIDGWRHYRRPTSFRNRANMVEDEVVDALSTAVTSDYARLSHRYYALKAKWLGLPKLQHWDRNAPLPEDQDGSIPMGRGAGPRALGLWRLLAGACSGRAAVLRQSLDRCRAAARQVGRGVRAPHRALGAPVPPGELPRQDPRRDDPGA